MITIRKCILGGAMALTMSIIQVSPGGATVAKALNAEVIGTHTLSTYWGIFVDHVVTVRVFLRCNGSACWVPSSAAIQRQVHIDIHGIPATERNQLATECRSGCTIVLRAVVQKAGLTAWEILHLQLHKTVLVGRKSE